MDSKLTVTVSNQIKSNQTLFIKHIYKVMYKRQLQKEKEWINIAKWTVYTVVIQSNRLSNKAWQNQTVLKAISLLLYFFPVQNNIFNHFNISIYGEKKGIDWSLYKLFASTVLLQKIK